MFARAIVPGCVLLALLISRDSKAEEASQLQFELIDAIDTAMISGAALSPYDVVGKVSVTEEFGEVVVPRETIKFRLRFDREREIVVWAFERRREKMDDTRPGTWSPGPLTIAANIIQGNRVRGYRGGSATEVKQKSFADCVKACSIPHVEHWGLLEFPFWGDAESRMQELAVRIASNSSKVFKKRTPTGIHYTLREDHAPGRFDIREWEFRLPSHVPTKRKISRAAANSRLVVYEEEEVLYENRAGVQVPVTIIGSHKIRKKSTGSIETGVRYTVSEFKWLETGEQTTAADLENLGFESHLGIMKFIDMKNPVAKHQKH